MTMRICVKALIVAFLLGGCQWVGPPPDMIDEAYRNGAIAGCIRMHVWRFGPPQNEEKLIAVAIICRGVADELDAMGNPVPLGPVNPQAVPRPVVTPDGTV